MWLSHTYPAGKFQDITITKKEWNSLKRGFRSVEHCLADRAWSNESLGDQTFLVSGHIKPKKRELTEQQVAENDVLGHFRGILKKTYENST